MTDDLKSEEKRRKAIASEVREDFKRRQEERRALERSWQLNMNFVAGRQYCDVNSLGEIEATCRQYFWQGRRVFNYIAPVVDTRCSKLSGIRPKLAVRAASEDEGDRRSAQLASSILAATWEDCAADEAVSAATVWSETCGTAFYKVVWDCDGGSEIAKTPEGKSVKGGKVRICALSPFEIYPHSISEESLEAQPSIIHARALPVDDIFAAYGVKVAGRDIADFTLSPAASGSSGLSDKPYCAVKHGYEVVIERYERPDSRYPDGRLTIVAGDELLYDGDLPYLNGVDGKRGYPFVRQCSLPLAGSFYGTSVVERLIPVQRAYNAVKNRKHEFLNRISMGMLAVEEGSVDTDELIDDGLEPGKVIVYRQGGTPPEMLTLGTVPSGFTEEEERLESEFANISGTSDLTQNASSFKGVTSATGLQLIIEQDEARLNVCYEQIKSALKNIGRLTLRLYKQFASSVHLLRYASNNDAASVISFKGSDITSDDVVLEADNDINLTPARRRTVLCEMIDRGLFSDENGKLSPAVRGKLLESLGYNGFTGERDLGELHRKKCAEENQALKEGAEAEVKVYDDHAVHVEEHTAYLLCEKLTPEEEERICAHLKQHKLKLQEEGNNEGQPNGRT